MAGPVFSKEKKAQIKGELESLLSTYSGGPNNDEDNIDEQLAEIAAAPPLDFIEMNAEFEKQAKNITNSMLKFYVELGVLEKHEYLKQKQILTFQKTRAPLQLYFLLIRLNFLIDGNYMADLGILDIILRMFYLKAALKNLLVSSLNMP